ncbi:hypothetical protein HWV62_33191 [Athelia sp. TMB]|nr:hypothetical protein HWV62_33191 [Athelia sp. TMB]
MASLSSKKDSSTSLPSTSQGTPDALVPPHPTKQLSAASSSSSPASDGVDVYVNISSMSLPPYKTGVTMQFHDGMFSLADAACLLKAVSVSFPLYNTLNENCFWFAMCVARLANSKYEATIVNGGNSAELGRIGLLSIVPTGEEADNKMRALWDEFGQESRITKSSLEKQSEMEMRVAQEAKAREAAEMREAQEAKGREAAERRVAQEAKGREVAERRAEAAEGHNNDLERKVEELLKLLHIQEGDTGLQITSRPASP